eukprot:TRINITY_DN11454_c0_g1_i2.p1 TRINITY_DN11454_c0_g1~~TRINITY_DN11454_c0_g1_i2.p1  ORF type:complete len:179 (+),score=33.19 TRINITY_DN11454_c0_g1_i2:403-939(+)
MRAVLDLPLCIRNTALSSSSYFRMVCDVDSLTHGFGVADRVEVLIFGCNGETVAKASCRTTHKLDECDDTLDQLYFHVNIDSPQHKFTLFKIDIAPPKGREVFEGANCTALLQWLGFAGVMTPIEFVQLLFFVLYDSLERIHDPVITIFNQLAQRGVFQAQKVGYAINEFVGLYASIV